MDIPDKLQRKAGNYKGWFCHTFGITSAFEYWRFYAWTDGCCPWGRMFCLWPISPRWTYLGQVSMDYVKKKQKYYLWQFPRWVLWINQKQLKRLNQSELEKWMTCCLCDVFVLAPNLKLKLNSVVRSWEKIKKWWELAGMLTWYCELQMSSHITIEIEFQAGVYGRVCEYM